MKLPPCQHIQLKAIATWHCLQMKKHCWKKISWATSKFHADAIHMVHSYGQKVVLIGGMYRRALRLWLPSTLSWRAIGYNICVRACTDEPIIEAWQLQASKCKLLMPCCQAPCVHAFATIWWPLLPSDELWRVATWPNLSRNFSRSSSQCSMAPASFKTHSLDVLLSGTMFACCCFTMMATQASWWALESGQTEAPLWSWYACPWVAVYAYNCTKGWHVWAVNAYPVLYICLLLCFTNQRRGHNSIHDINIRNPHCTMTSCLLLPDAKCRM